MSRPQSAYVAVPTPNDSQVNRGYASQPNTGVSDFAQGNPDLTSPLSQSMSNSQHVGAFHEDFDASRPSSSIVGGGGGGGEDGISGPHRTSSTASTAVPATAPSRNNTLKKKSSMRRTNSLKRSSSKRSLKAGGLAGFGGVGSNKDYNSAFSTPIPTQGAPTEILADRFQAWRQLLKSLIAYFREIQASYEQRAKAVHKVQGIIASITHPTIFMSHNGLGEATRVLDEYHKRSITEANKSREIENDVIGALTGLRSDLSQKIKEIKSLSGDFKNSVDKEKDATRREVEKLQEALQHADHEDGTATGKNDPFVVRLGVDRVVEKQIDEENYLHRAYLNLESSGRELESIVVGEIQKAYNALAGILKREGDDAYNTVEALRTGPISMPKDVEWMAFVQNDPHFVDPNVPLRRFDDIEYPGKHHPAAAEVRAGMLERKSKYLKSYTPGWYVLSPTHLHEFKSADKIYSQPPVMSLYLPDQRLGSRSQDGSSSHKFMLKGKQSGNMHKGHNWVFRAESYDTMLAWFEDIRVLTEKTGEERNAFVRKHARSLSATSDRATVSSDGMEEDEADAVPYSADAASLANQGHEAKLQRPAPGGRFPSDLQVPRDRRPTQTSSSNDSEDPESSRGTGAVAMAGALPRSMQSEYRHDGQDPYRLDGVSAGSRTAYAGTEGGEGSYFDGGTPSPEERREQAVPEQQQQQQQSFLGGEPADPSESLARHNTSYGDWVAPRGAGLAGAGVGAVGVEAYRRHQEDAAVPVADGETPEMPEKSDQRSNPPDSENFVALDTNTSAAQPETDANRAVEPDQQTAMASSAIPPVGGLGGNEIEGAHETGNVFPKFIRHDTDMSISALHVPGEFPKRI